MVATYGPRILTPVDSKLDDSPELGCRGIQTDQQKDTILLRLYRKFS